MNAPQTNTPVQVIPFIAESATDAVAQIRARLGPDAVVVNVRQLPADGLAKLWKSPRIEVLAYKPEAQATTGAMGLDSIAELKQELQAIRQQLGPASSVPSGLSALGLAGGPGSEIVHRPGAGARSAGPVSWRVGEVLETSGLMPVHTQRVLERLQSNHGEAPP